MIGRNIPGRAKPRVYVCGSQLVPLMNSQAARRRRRLAILYGSHVQFCKAYSTKGTGYVLPCPPRKQNVEFFQGRCAFNTHVRPTVYTFSRAWPPSCCRTGNFKKHKNVQRVQRNNGWSVRIANNGWSVRNYSMLWRMPPASSAKLPLLWAQVTSRGHRRRGHPSSKPPATRRRLKRHCQRIARRTTAALETGRTKSTKRRPPGARTHRKSTPSRGRRAGSTRPTASTRPRTRKARRDDMPKRRRIGGMSARGVALS